MSAFECSPCGREFTTLAAFDKHQDVNYSRWPAVVCQDPAAVGLVQNSLGRWHFPVDASSRARLTKMRSEQPRTHTSVTPQATEGGTTA